MPIVWGHVYDNVPYMCPHGNHTCHMCATCVPHVLTRMLIVHLAIVVWNYYNKKSSKRLYSGHQQDFDSLLLIVCGVFFLPPSGLHSCVQ